MVQIGGKQYELKRPVLRLLLEADKFEKDAILFRYTETFASLTKSEVLERAKKEWTEYLTLVLAEPPGEELALDNIVYPDDVREVQRSFFMSPWEGAINEQDALKKRLPSSASQRSAQ